MVGALPACDLVIDGAYGTGFRGSYDAPAVPSGATVLAIDIPSGVDADTGEAPGHPVHADRTVTFAALKPGLLEGDGEACSGTVEVADIGIGFPPPGASQMEDGGRRGVVAGAPEEHQQVDQRGRHRGGLARDGGVGDPQFARRDGRGLGHDPARLAR